MHPSTADLSLGVLADFPGHVVGALDQRPGDVVVVNGDDGQRDQKVNQEDHHWVDLWMHLIGQRVRHAVHKGDVGVVTVTLRRNRVNGGSSSPSELLNLTETMLQSLSLWDEHLRFNQDVLKVTNTQWRMEQTFILYLQRLQHISFQLILCFYVQQYISVLSCHILS